MATYFPPSPGFGAPGPVQPAPFAKQVAQGKVKPQNPAVIAQNSPAGIAIARAQAAKAAALRGAGMNARYGLGGKTVPTASKTPPPGVPAPWTGLGGGAPAPGAPPVTTPVAAPSIPPVSVPNDSGYQNLFNQIMQSALGLYNSPNGAANSLINPKAILAGLSGAEINPNQVGNDAGLGYDAQLAQQNRNYGTTQNQNAQNISDISSWFNQAKQTQQAGAADNAKAFAAQLSGQSDAAQAFINSLGGSASPGAAGIANASDIASAALRGEGLANTNFDNNMAGVVGLDQVQQLRNEQTAGNNRLQTLMDQIAQTKGDKAGAVAQARDNAQQQLFGQKSGLAQLNANLQGNLFNEKQGLRQQKLSELGGLSNAVLGAALAPSQIQAAQLGNLGTAASIRGQSISNAGNMAQIKAFLNQNGTAKNNISSAPLSVRNGIMGQFSAKGGQFVNANGDLKMAPTAIKSALRSQLINSLGLQDGPSLETFLNGLTQSVVTPLRVQNYDKAHKTNFYKQGGYGK